MAPLIESSVFSDRMGEGERVKFTQDGSVVKITMKNFMTYKHETIYPGRF